MLYDSDKPFKILSIDGGGIRGIYPSRFLAELEYQLKQEGKQVTQLNKYFDLICGTSTGGIIAIGLALGMQASEIMDIYKNNAKKIFGNEKNWFSAIFKPFHQSFSLKSILKEHFSPYSKNGVTRLGHAKTRLCIPIYDAGKGRVRVNKTSHHPELYTDYQYPAHDVALSTSSAPFYFKPHSFSFNKIGSEEKENIINNIDGGIFANNPTLIGITEAIKALEVPLKNLKVLSIGTGSKVFTEKKIKDKYGAYYWAFPKNPKIFDLMATAQSDNVANLIKLFNEGIGNNSTKQFLYERVNFCFGENTFPEIKLNESNVGKLQLLENQACDDFQVKGSKIIHEFCDQPITPYTPYYKL